MTVSVPNATWFGFVGNGVTTAFSFPLRFLAGAELIVEIDGSVANPAGYTVTGDNSPGGGTLTFTEAPAADTAITIRRATAAKQVVDLDNLTKSSSGAVEIQLDRLAMVDQDQARDLDRSWKAGVGEAPGIIEVGASGSTVMFDDDGNLVAGPTLDELSAGLSTPLSIVDVDAALGANSDLRVASQKAIRHHVAYRVVNGVDGSHPDFGMDEDALDNSSALNDLFTYCRSNGWPAGIPPGEFWADGLDWAYISGHGGYGRLTINGCGMGGVSLIKKATNDGQPLFTIGRSSGSWTVQGGIVVRDLALDGISGGTEEVLSLWSLTQFSLENVRVQKGARCIAMHDVVTGRGHNVAAQNGIVGLYLDRVDFADATFSDPNLITFDASVFASCSKWGIDFHDGKMLNLNGCQIEANGTTSDNTTGGLHVDATAGDFTGVNRKGVAVNAKGSWFEANAGRAAIVLEGGVSAFYGCNMPSNPNATRDLYSDGGKFELHGCSIVPAKTGGNIETTANTPIGCSIVGGEISSLDATKIDLTKVTLQDVSVGTTAPASRWSRYRGKAPVLAPGTDDILIQTGIDSQASGSTVTFGEEFGTTPLSVTFGPAGNDPTRVQSVTFYNLSSTGFTIEKKHMINGSNTVTTDSSTVYWTAIGQKA